MLGLLSVDIKFWLNTLVKLGHHDINHQVKMAARPAMYAWVKPKNCPPSKPSSSLRKSSPLFIDANHALVQDTSSIYSKEKIKPK